MSTAAAAAAAERTARASNQTAENVTLATLASGQFSNILGAATIGTALVATAQGIRQFRQAAESAGFVTEAMIELDTVQREVAINAGRVFNQLAEPFTRLQTQALERRNETLQTIAENQEAGTASVAEQLRGGVLGTALAIQENVPVVGDLSKAIQPLTDAIGELIRQGLGGTTVVISPEVSAEARFIRDARALGHEGAAAVNPGSAFEGAR